MFVLCLTMFSFYLIPAIDSCYWLLLLTPDTDFWHWSFFFDSFFRYCFFWFLGLYGSFIELRLQWFFLQWFFLWVFFWLLFWVSSIAIFWYWSFLILVFSDTVLSSIVSFSTVASSWYSDFLLIRLSLYATSFDWLMTLISFDWFSSYADSFLCDFLWLSSLFGSFDRFPLSVFLIEFLWSSLLWFFLLRSFFLWSSLSDSTDWPSFFGFWIFWIVVFEITEKFYRKFLTFLRRILYFG